jgi:hypothetical protein
MGRGKEENEEEVAEEDRLRTTRTEEKILIYFQVSNACSCRQTSVSTW